MENQISIEQLEDRLETAEAAQCCTIQVGGVIIN